MAEILVVRHGQAAFGTDNYDRLTECGWSQSRALGQYFRSIGLTFNTVITGEMQRHKETLSGLSQGQSGLPKASHHDHFNECDFHGLVDAYLLMTGEQPDLSDRRIFFRCFRKALTVWQQNKLMGVVESWSNFDARAKQCMTHMLSLSGTALIVTSGGIASAILRHALELNPDKMFDLNLQALNTGVTRYFSNSDNLMLNGFNAIPHLETPELRNLITYA